jgi:hypothetical protein
MLDFASGRYDASANAAELELNVWVTNWPWPLGPQRGRQEERALDRFWKRLVSSYRHQGALNLYSNLLSSTESRFAHPAPASIHHPSAYRTSQPQPQPAVVAGPPGSPDTLDARRRSFPVARRPSLSTLWHRCPRDSPTAHHRTTLPTHFAPLTDSFRHLDYRPLVAHDARNDEHDGGRTVRDPHWR